MIAVAPIVPTAYLETMSEAPRSVYLALAHQVLGDPVYRDFFRQQKAYVVLDNSAFELGAALSSKDILQAMTRIQPQEIVLPDVLYEATETVQRVQDFLKAYVPLLPTGIRYMAVPHGKTMQEYVECYKKLAAMPHVHTLGIGTIYNSAFEGGRTAIFQTLQTQGTLSSKPHHLLGLGDSGNLELEKLKKYAVIRSCDSSAAYMQARHGVQLVEGQPYKKIREKINFSDPYDETRAVAMRTNQHILQEASR